MQACALTCPVPLLKYAAAGVRAACCNPCFPPPTANLWGRRGLSALVGRGGSAMCALLGQAWRRGMACWCSVQATMPH